MAILNQCLAFVACAFFMCSNTSSVWSRQDTEERFTETPEIFRLFGTISDLQQQPLANATVTIVFPNHGLYYTGADFWQEPWQAQATSDENGRYEIQLSSNDPRLTHSYSPVLSTRIPFVTVDHPEKFIGSKTLPLQRMAVHLPLDFQLEPRHEQRLQVLAADGQPVCDAEVSVAEYNGLLMPRLSAPLKQQTTDSNGYVQLPGIDLDRRAGVYVVSKELGNQVAAVVPTSDGHVSRLMPVGEVFGTVRLPAGASPEVFAGRRVLLMRYATTSANRDGTWCLTTLNQEGQFHARNMGLGKFNAKLLDWQDLPFRQDENSEYQTFSLESGGQPSTIEMRFEHALPLRLNFVDEKGLGVPGMGVEEHYSERTSPVQVSDKLGHLPSWRFAEGQLTGQVFLSPTSWNILSPEFSVFQLDKRTLIENDLSPITLVRSRALQGRTMDRQGQIIPGATVSYSYTFSTGALKFSTISDVEGAFKIFGLPPDVVVQLTATKDDWRTAKDEIFDRRSGHPADIDLVLHQQTAFGFSGVVQGSDGSPIPNARVRFYQGQVYREESHSAASMRQSPLGEENLSYRTDINGRYVHPPVFDCDYVQLEVSSPGYHSVTTPCLNVAKRDVADGYIDLGQVELHRLPVERMVTVSCVDSQTEKPLADVELLAMGMHTPSQTVQSDLQGLATLRLADTESILAAKLEGYQLVFLCVSPSKHQITVKLQTVSEQYMTPQALPGLHRDVVKEQALAIELFNELDPIAPDATFYRFQQYLLSEAITHPQRVLDALRTPDTKYPYPINLWRDCLPFIATLDAEGTAAFFGSANYSAVYKQTLLTALALELDDPALQEELLSECVLLLSQNDGGKNDLSLTAALAKTLLFAGYTEAAQTIVSQAWTRDTELHEILRSQSASTARPESRYWMPILGIHDPDAAIQLIRMTADSVQKDYLVQECLTYLGIVDLPQMRNICGKYQLSYDGRGADSLLRHIAEYGRAGPSVREFVRSTALELPLGTERVAISLLAMRETSSAIERQKLMELIVQVWREYTPSHTFMEMEMMQSAVRQVMRFDTLSPYELDRIVFECLRKAPTSLGNLQAEMMLGSIVKLLAMRDPDLARVFLEPYFREGGWLSAGQQVRFGFLHNPILAAAVWADPAWAAELARRYGVEVGRFEPLKKLELYNCVIHELGQLRK
jgi:hypothetical protein